jgi:myo-inositol-1(or 4)-monophosphatase
MITQNQLQDFFQTALTAAQVAGNIVRQNLNKSLEIDFKGRANAVTQVDRKSENTIISIIKDKYSDHSIIAEERPAIDTNSDYKWIIDPLDGTTNYIHGFPVFSISIALALRNEAILGVVYDPTREELFSAIKNSGAYLNKNKISVSKVKNLSAALVATGFPYEIQENFYLNMKIFQNMYKNTQGVRRAGSAAIDLCYVAGGRLDGFWEFDLNPWDLAAGALIVQEAGGLITDSGNNTYCLDNRHIIASNQLIHKEMYNIISTTS